MACWMGGICPMLLGSAAWLLGCGVDVESMSPGSRSPPEGSGVAEAEVVGAPRPSPPPAWERRQSICDSASFYSVNPAHNPDPTPTCVLGKYKRLYYTTGPIENGWVPVYSAGQERLHTGWVRQECLVIGWPYAQEGSITC